MKFNSLWIAILHMGLGTILAQLINVVAQPLLTRLFSAETLGIYTYLISLATIVIPVASLKLDMLVVSEADDNEAQYMTDACIVLVVLVSVIYTITITIGYILPNENIFNKYGAVIFVVPLIVFVNGMRFIFISYLNRYKEYKMISVLGIIREGARALIQVGAGLFSSGVFLLSIGYAIAPLFGLNMQLKQYLQKMKIRPRLTVLKFKEVVFEKGRRQIMFLLPAQFINTFSSSLITVSIANLYSAKVLGYYSVGTRILEIPIIFIAANVSKVCYQKVSENIANNRPVSKIVLSIVTVLSIISALGFTLLYFIAPNISEIVFGSGYSIAGEYIRCLIIMYAVRLVTTSFAGVFTAFRKQRFELIINILLVVMAGTSYLICEKFGYEVEVYLNFINWSYSIVYLLMLSAYIIECYNYDKFLKRVK